LNILSTMFYSKMTKALANMTVSDGVSRSPKGGGAGSAPSKSANVGLSSDMLVYSDWKSYVFVPEKAWLFQMKDGGAYFM